MRFDRFISQNKRKIIYKIKVTKKALFLLLNNYIKSELSKKKKNGDLMFINILLRYTALNNNENNMDQMKEFCENFNIQLKQIHAHKSKFS